MPALESDELLLWQLEGLLVARVAHEAERGGEGDDSGGGVGGGGGGAHSEAMSPRPSRCFDEAGLDIKFVEARVDWQL